MNTLTATTMEALGANSWTPSRGGETRYYLNNWEQLAGLDVERYKSGNVSYAEFQGEKVSNAEARRMLATKVWWSASKGLVIQTDGCPRNEDELIDAIEAGIAEAVARL